MTVSFNIAQLKDFLNQSMVKAKDVQDAVSIFNKCNENGDSVLADDEVSNFSKACLMKLGFNLNCIIRGFLSSMTSQPVNQQTLSEAEILQDREILEQKVRYVYEEARNELIEQLSRGDFKYTDPNTGQEISAQNLIKYLKGENMYFAPSDYGAAQAHKDTGTIEVNTTPSDGYNILLSSMHNISKEEVMKILLHEALHCTYPVNYAIQEEEMFVESNAIKLMAQIIKNSNGQVSDVQILRYGESILELAEDDAHLESVLKEKFINNGYEHRTKNKAGDVNIEGYEIRGGDKVYIDGKESGSIGTDLYIDELTSDDIRLYTPDKNKGQIYTEAQPNSVPIKITNNEGRPNYEAFLVLSDPDNEIMQDASTQDKTFRNSNGDTITLEDGYTITIDGASYVIGRNGVELQALDGFRGQLAILHNDSEPELISQDLIFDNVQPDSDKQNEYGKRQFKEFVVFDRNGSPIYKGKMYL